MKTSYLRTFTILLTVGVILLAVGLIVPFMSTAESGIIGDPNDSIYAFIAWLEFHSLWGALALLGGAAILTSVFALIFHKSVSKTCRVITSAHSLALSVFGSAGLVFLIYISIMLDVEDVARYPYALPAFMVCAVLCIILCIGLLISYFRQWFKRASFGGLFIEVLLTIICFPGLFLLNMGIINFLWGILSNFI